MLWLQMSGDKPLISVYVLMMYIFKIFLQICVVIIDTDTSQTAQVRDDFIKITQKK
jgi:hypothetical protein